VPLLKLLLGWRTNHRVRDRAAERFPMAKVSGG
jgi:hypothetical protein